MLRECLTKLDQNHDPKPDPREMARIVMARQILSARRAVAQSTAAADSFRPQ